MKVCKKCIKNNEIIIWVLCEWFDDAALKFKSIAQRFIGVSCKHLKQLQFRVLNLY